VKRARGYQGGYQARFAALARHRRGREHQLNSD
jgi:hypothetical protein